MHSFMYTCLDMFKQRQVFPTKIAPPPQIKSLPFAILFHIQINRSLQILEQYVKNIYKLKICMYICLLDNSTSMMQTNVRYLF